MKKTENDLRAEIVAGCLEMNAGGINQGVSGNISARFRDRMLITPSATPYDRMRPEMIASISLDDPSGAWEGPLRPSTEWRFHYKLMRLRSDASAIVHAHPPHCTALAMTRTSIPSCHYMIAAFGGNDVRCADYATFGTDALADLAFDAMRDRTACLLANHGMVVIGETLEQAMWRAVELETIARHHCLALSIGGPILLSDGEMADAHDAFAGYGTPGGNGKAGRIVERGSGSASDA